MKNDFFGFSVLLTVAFVKSPLFIIFYKILYRIVIVVYASSSYYFLLNCNHPLNRARDTRPPSQSKKPPLDLDDLTQVVVSLTRKNKNAFI